MGKRGDSLGRRRGSQHRLGRVAGQNLDDAEHDEGSDRERRDENEQALERKAEHETSRGDGDGRPPTSAGDYVAMEWAGKPAGRRRIRPASVARPSVAAGAEARATDTLAPTEARATAGALPRPLDARPHGVAAIERRHVRQRSPRSAVSVAELDAERIARA